MNEIELRFDYLPTNIYLWYTLVFMLNMMHNFCILDLTDRVKSYNNNNNNELDISLTD